MDAKFVRVLSELRDKIKASEQFFDDQRCCCDVLIALRRSGKEANDNGAKGCKTMLGLVRMDDSSGSIGFALDNNGGTANWR